MHFFNFFLLAFAGFAFSKLSTEPAPKEMKLTPLSMWTDIVMWQKPIKEFVRLRNMKLGPEGMIWEADGCTSAAEKPLGWDCTYETISKIELCWNYKDISHPLSLQSVFRLHSSSHECV